ncbi:competence type IV pilus assembly protein ComGB [Bacillus cihuensis]|uniref:competence type IV pilus assembly protein ComGB n=1 Tax=Bacillus cihuensis TaxID=1208599 RepID=UPI0004250963|nr:competence type IV pilus assembly protein ComGB [Bacillus cihuensis]
MKRSNWKMKEQSQFLLKLGELLEFGYPLAEAIQFLMLQHNKKKETDLQRSISALRSGNPFHSVLTMMNFHPQLVHFIYFSEAYGNLPKALQEAGLYWGQRNDDIEKLKKIFLYPFFLIFFVTLVFYMMKTVLLPKIQLLFQTMNADETLLLQVILVFVNFLDLLPYFLVFAIIVYLLLHSFYLKKLSPFKRQNLLLRIPLVGTFIKLYETHFFASQLSGLLAGGLSINESITLFARSGVQPFYHDICQLIKNELTEGKPLDAIFRDLPYFEKRLGVITANGQKSGRLEQELYMYSRFILDQAEEKMKGLMQIIQPTLFSLIGLVIVSIYLAVLLPMFSLMKGL